MIITKEQVRDAIYSVISETRLERYDMWGNRRLVRAEANQVLYNRIREIINEILETKVMWNKAEIATHVNQLLSSEEYIDKIVDKLNKKQLKR